MTEETTPPQENTSDTQAPQTSPATETAVSGEDNGSFAEQANEPAAVAEEEAKPKIFLNVTLEKEVTGAKDKDSEFQRPIGLLSVSLEKLDELAKDYAKIDITADRETRRWLAALDEGRQHGVVGGSFIESIAREGSDWRQNVQHDGVKLSIGRPSFGGAAADQKLTGQRAVIKMQSALGIGSTVQVPLWHSGIWLTINAPSDSKLLIMERRISDEKITLGRLLHGLVYAHSSVYTVNHLLTLLLDCVYDATIKDYSAEKLLKAIKVTDLTSLALGFACTIYPNGYDHKQPCVLHPDKCKHVSEEKLNLARLFFYDQTAITTEQRRHMAERNKKHTDEEILKYQTLGKIGESKTFKLNDEVTVVLKVPTLADYLESGTTWIQSIENMVSEALTGRPTDEQKDEFITQQSVATIFRQYAHWVDKIIFRDNDVIDDKESIQEVLSMLSSDQKLYEVFFDEIKKYIDDSTICVVGIPAYNCPSCGTPMAPEERKHPNIIPIDVINLFFTLARRRLERTRM